ncbi:MAG: hypothetical protein RLZZ383_1247 [Pseudomonadota bacterium]
MIAWGLAAALAGEPARTVGLAEGAAQPITAPSGASAARGPVCAAFRAGEGWALTACGADLSPLFVTDAAGVRREALAGAADVLAIRASRPPPGSTESPVFVAIDAHVERGRRATFASASTWSEATLGGLLAWCRGRQDEAVVVAWLEGCGRRALLARFDPSRGAVPMRDLERAWVPMGDGVLASSGEAAACRGGGSEVLLAEIATHDEVCGRRVYPAALAARPPTLNADPYAALGALAPAMREVFAASAAVDARVTSLGESLAATRLRLDGLAAELGSVRAEATARGGTDREFVAWLSQCTQLDREVEAQRDALSTLEPRVIGLADDAADLASEAARGSVAAEDWSRWTAFAGRIQAQAGEATQALIALDRRVTLLADAVAALRTGGPR